MYKEHCPCGHDLVSLADFDLKALINRVHGPVRPESRRRTMRTPVNGPVRGLPANRIPPARSGRVRRP